MAKREPKSRRRIINAFMALRACLPLEKITVVALCGKADVNKSTFYAYFHDIYDLSEQLQRDAADRIIQSVSHPGAVLDDPGLFTRELLQAFQANRTITYVLFSGTSFQQLPDQLIRAISGLIEKIRPGALDSDSFRLTLSYMIYGGFYAFAGETKTDEASKIRYIAGLSGKVFHKETH